MTTKVCRICGIEKPAADFNRAGHSPDGLYTYCKPCASRRQAAWYEQNREHAVAKIRAWQQRTGFPADRARRVTLEERGVPIVDFVRRRVVFDRAGGRCQSCGATLTFRGGDRWDVDHIAPVAAGGVHAYSNVQALCVPCHKAKTAKEKPPA